MHVLISFNGGYLYFEPCRFLYTDHYPVLSPPLKGEKIKYDEFHERLSISLIKEDEGTSYFFKLSNNDIFLIHQTFDGDGMWLDKAEMVYSTDTKRYGEIMDYMNEEFVNDVRITCP